MVLSLIFCSAYVSADRYKQDDFFLSILLSSVFLVFLRFLTLRMMRPYTCNCLVIRILIEEAIRKNSEDKISKMFKEESR